MSLSPYDAKKNYDLVLAYNVRKKLYPAGNEIQASWSPISSPDEAQQKEVARLIGETFKKLDEVHYWENGREHDLPARCKFKRRFLKGVEKIQSAHAENSSYAAMAEGVKTQVSEMQAALDKEALLSFHSKMGLKCDKKGRLKLVPGGKSLLLEAQQKRIADVIMVLVEASSGEEQNKLLESAKQLIMWAEEQKLVILEGKLKSDLKARGIQTALSTLKKSIQEAGFYKDDEGMKNAILKMTDDLKRLLANPNEQKEGLYPLVQNISKYSDALWEFAHILAEHQEDLAKCSCKYPELAKQLQSEIDGIHAVQVKLLQGFPELIKTPLSQGIEALKKQKIEEARSPFQQLQDKLKIICDYQPTRIAVLYADQDLLNYSQTMSFTPAVQEAVATWIRAQVDAMWKHYGQAPTCERGQWLQLASQASRGLKRIADDYVKYPEFKKKVEGVLQELNDAISGYESTLQMELHALRKRPNVTLFDLWNVGVLNPQLPKDFIQQIATRMWGERLAEHVLATYLKAGQTALNQQDLKWLLIAAAADVKREDVERQANPSFAQLSYQEQNQLLDRFRKGPNGQSLLAFFQIPLEDPKRTIALSEYNRLDPKCPVDMNRFIALQVLADIESVALWDKPRTLLMPKKEMIANLLKFLSSARKPNLFHDDHYLSLLQAAGPIIAFAKQAKPEDKPVLTALFYALQESKLACAIHYRPSYCGKLARLLSALHKAVEPLLDDQPFAEAELIKCLARHPKQSPMACIDPLEASLRFKPSEYLARKVAYWNKYYLESSLHLDSKSEVKEELFRTQIRTGTLFTLPGQDRFYEIRKVINRHGLVCQIAAPVDGHLEVKQGKPVPLKIIFQGTIYNSNSLWRDKEVGGPGASFWAQGGRDEILSAIRNVMEEEQRRQQQLCTFATETSGHSLGGSDSQMAGSALAAAVHSNPFFTQYIASIKVTTCNPAGIPLQAAKDFAKVVNARPELLEGVMHSLVKGDIVETSGETKIGFGVEMENRIVLLESLNHYVNGNATFDALAKHCDLVHSHGPFLLPMQVLDPARDKKFYELYFKGIGQNLGTFFEHADHILQQQAFTEALANVSKSLSKVAWGVYSSSSFKEIPDLEKSIRHLEEMKRNVEQSDKLDQEAKKRQIANFQLQIASHQDEIRRLNSLTPQELHELRAKAEEENRLALQVWNEGIAHGFNFFSGIKRALWDGGRQSLES